MQFTLKSLFALTATIAILLCVGILVGKNLHLIHGVVGFLCILAIPTSPFILGFGGYAGREFIGITKLQGSVLGVVLGLCVSLGCYFLLGHVICNYWAG
jgi:hypothetical protein